MYQTVSGKSSQLICSQNSLRAMDTTPSLSWWTVSPSGPRSFQPHLMSPCQGSPTFFKTISGSFMAYLRKSSATREPNSSQNSCGDSANSLGSESQCLQPITHRLVDKWNMSTSRLNTSFDSSLINNKTTGTNGSPMLSSPTMTRSTPRHNPLHSCSMLAKTLN